MQAKPFALIAILLLALAIYAALRTELPTTTLATREAKEHFTRHVLPLLEAKCVACHGADPSDVQSGLDLTTREGLLRGGESGQDAVVPGRPDEGLLIEAIRGVGTPMPPKEEDRLNAAQVAAFEKWIAHGAPWPSEETQQAIQQTDWQQQENDEGVIVNTSGGLADEWTNRRYKHDDLWAYQPIRKPDIDSQHGNPIDLLIDQQLASVGLSAAPIADPFALVRRATFDVIGLPPTPQEVQDFVAAWSADADVAWSQLIERLLASPHYGEQAARHWLDVVRYADSGGFANDWQRPNAWRYRDYVIRAFNQDKPYDDFLREQVAGDELNAHDPEMKVAVGFLRMGPWEHSAMSVPKIARQQYLDDVTDAVGQVFLAHPLQCARCHDHKFDPVPTRDYYAIQAVFATTQLAEVDAAWLPSENISGMKQDQLLHQQKRSWNEQIVAELADKQAAEELAWFRDRGLPYKTRQEAIAADAPDDDVPVNHIGLDANDLGRLGVGRKWQFRFNWEQTRYKPIALSVYTGTTRLPMGVNKRTKVPADPLEQGVLEQTTVLRGGDPYSPGEPVSPGVLSVAAYGHPFRITRQPRGRRRGLAEWLVDEKNPLVARVMANRIWQTHFGRGIVGTPNNFGAKGKKPTHPELLDFLAASFAEQGWSMKRLHRMILTSQTYRRSSQHPDLPALERVDPQRKLYAAFLPRRMAAEELRDAMLSMSGELNPVLGGIPARPDMNLEAALQPRMIMSSIAPAYVPHSKPAQRNRRTIYALKLRGLRDPFLEVFNQPSPDIVCELRDQSNVTPQVFSLLNSQESTDRAVAIAKRLLKTEQSNLSVVEQLFWLLYGRQPTSDETAATIQHWKKMQSIEAEVDHQPLVYPTQILRHANDENTGEVFEFVERLFEYENYTPDLQIHEVDARTAGLANVCLMMINSNEFVYIY